MTTAAATRRTTRGPGRLGRQPARVVVVGNASVAELAMLRGLDAGGYEPFLMTWDPHGPAAHSRLARKVIAVPSPTDRSDGLVESIGKWSRRAGASLVIPGVEAALVALAGHARLEGGAIVAAGPPEIVGRVTSKPVVNAAAGRVGLRTPPSARASAARLPDSGVSYPAVVKPAHSVERTTGGDLRRFAVRVVTNRDELVTALAAMPADVVIQDYVNARLRTLNGVFWEGELIGAVHQIGERLWPPGRGVLCASRTVEPDVELERLTSRLLADLGWQGIFNLQFLDAGTPLLMDLNPRPYQSLGLALAAGVNLPAIWADLLLGARPRVAGYQVGVRWRYLRDDLLALAVMARSGNPQSALRGLLPQRGTVDAVLSRGDPLPILAVARRDIVKIMRRVQLLVAGGTEPGRKRTTRG